MINIITTKSCPLCIMAKHLINDLWFEYKEVVLEFWDDELNKIISITWLMSVPQIFAWEVSKENLLWGFDDISKLNNEWKLIQILEKANTNL